MGAAAAMRGAAALVLLVAFVAATALAQQPNDGNLQIVIKREGMPIYGTSPFGVFDMGTNPKIDTEKLLAKLAPGKKFMKKTRFGTQFEIRSSDQQFRLLVSPDMNLDEATREHHPFTLT